MARAGLLSEYRTMPWYMVLRGDMLDFVAFCLSVMDFRQTVIFILPTTELCEKGGLETRSTFDADREAYRAVRRGDVLHGDKALCDKVVRNSLKV